MEKAMESLARFEPVGLAALSLRLAANPRSR